MNLPNAVTLSRIFLVPVLVALLLTKYSVPIAAAVFLAASMTDFLDGYLARSRDQVTTLGMLLDPVADKLLISSAFISLVQLQIVPAWMVVVIIGREFAVTGLRSIAASQGFAIEASELGKLKMGAQVAAITMLIIGSEYPFFFNVAGRVALWMVVLFAIWSAVEYFRTFWSKIDSSFKAQQERRRDVLIKKSQGRHAPTQ
jgi:CDP-diacylglycerol--glycerol-3-phosphate 3-phosphatidyltransferase